MEYLKTLLSAAALVSVATALSPMREGIRRALSSAFSVLFLLFLIPSTENFDLGSLLSFSLPETESAQSAPAYSEAWREGIENGVLLDLSERFDLDPEALEIESTVKSEKGEVTIAYLSLTLAGENIFADATGIVRYIEKNYGCHSEIHLSG